VVWRWRWRWRWWRWRWWWWRWRGGLAEVGGSGVGRLGGRGLVVWYACGRAPNTRFSGIRTCRTVSPLRWPWVIRRYRAALLRRAVGLSGESTTLMARSSCACLRYLRLPSSGHSAWAVPASHRACGGHSRWWPWSSARRRQRPSFPGTLAAGPTTSVGERDRAQKAGGERKGVGPPHWRRERGARARSLVLQNGLGCCVREPRSRRRWGRPEVSRRSRWRQVRQ